MNHVTVLKLDIGDKTANPCADLDLFDGLETPGEFIPLGDNTLDRLRDRHWRRRRRSPRRRLFAATRQSNRQQYGQ
jgi:hypothetical protein